LQKQAFGLKTVPDCRIYHHERMVGLADRYGRVHESESRAETGCSGFAVFAADGFGLSVHKTAAQTTRDVIFTRDMRRRVSSADAAVANWKVIG
jgi:hypothetical protein